MCIRDRCVYSLNVLHLFLHTHRSQNSANLINELSAKLVGFIEHFCPQFWISSSHKVPCQAFKQRVFITDLDKTKTRQGIKKRFSWRVNRPLVAVGMDCLWLRQRLTVAQYLNELCITLSSFISYACQVGISFLTIFAYNFAIVVRVFPKKEKILIVTFG